MAVIETFGLSRSFGNTVVVESLPLAVASLIVALVSLLVAK